MNPIVSQPNLWIVLLCVSAWLAAATAVAPSATADQAPPQWRRGSTPAPGVYKAQITPHWFHNNTRFWYRNDLRGGAKEFILIDAERGTRNRAFDHHRLAEALSNAAAENFDPDRLPFDQIQFRENEHAIEFHAAGKAWKCDLNSYEIAELADPPAPTSAEAEQEIASERQRRSRNRPDPQAPVESPDGRWTAFVQEQNVWLRSKEGEEVQLSNDGSEGQAYGRLEWSPDSTVLVTWRIEPGDRKEVYLLESSPKEGGRAKLHARPYALPGDKFTTYELTVFNVTARSQLRPDVDRFEHQWLSPRLHWTTDGRKFTYQQTDRGHQRFRVIEIDPQTGTARNLIDERSETFIWTAHIENLQLDLVTWLKETDEIIYASERDGWRHLYLVDPKVGGIRNRITQGPWVVRAIDRIDEKTRQIWFCAGGMNPDQDPYFLHHYRVNVDGTGLVTLTDGNGHHSVQYSPDRKYLIDTYSRVDMPPVHDLRRAEDGALVCRLEQADYAELLESGWEAPEVFVAKGRDGKTDIWGIICRPRGLDPNAKYPVIEDIYAGPQGSFVPKAFSGTQRYASLNEAGFIVVKIDGMGTANRSKAFHDVCWKNLKDGGFKDRILWMKAAAAKYPYMDLTRVGVYGNSAGGQNAAAALLFHPEFYKVGVASCGCHDNRMDKASWNEQWMGYPVGPQYSESSNIDNAHRLRGKLLLIVGEMDSNVPPESTYRFVDALIKAGKDFDFLMIPGGGHGFGEYGIRRRDDFFVRHLLGKNPPDRNMEAAPHRKQPGE